MDTSDNNDTIFDQFLYIVDIAIEQGNPNMLLNAIKEFNDKIPSIYINMAKTMYQDLILEKIDNMTI